MNAMKGPEDALFFQWNKDMLKAVKQRFPQNLVMQSLGSFDGEYAKPLYRKMMMLPGNEVAQVHRYLDLGAQMEVCHAPMDVICASAIRDLQAYHAGKPIVLAETGAVEPKHAGPSKFYPKDTAGILLHDILFAPFFTGAAGTGMSWHWESYVHKNNLWYHFERFNEAVKGIDPVRESFVPRYQESAQFRMYVLKGKNLSLLWLRDKTNNWETELRDGVPPSLIRSAGISLPELRGAKKIEVYDPWTNQWTTVTASNKSITLPDFKRSLVVKITY